MKLTDLLKELHFIAVRFNGHAPLTLTCRVHHLRPSTFELEISGLDINPSLTVEDGSSGERSH